jgi:puromycin-sensitive aminopeptidase
LWDAIEAVNPHAPVRRMMDSWIWQPGYPLVTARLDGEHLVLSQQRFAYDHESLGDDAATLFVVPLHIRNGGHAADEFKVLLDSDETRVHLGHPDAPTVVNAGGHGFVRIAYDDTLRSRLVGPTITTMSVVERYNLVDDAWSALVAGRLGAPELLSFLEAFAGERDLAVWQAMGIALRGLGRLVQGDARAAFQARVRAFAAPALADLGWQPVDGEDDLTGKLRGLLVSTLAVLGADVAAQQRCRAIFDAPEGIHPELVAAAINVVAAVGDEHDYERFLEAFRTVATPQDQLRYLYALAEFPTAELVQRTCELAMSGEVRTQNAPFVLNRCVANRDHGEQAWGFVRRHWEEANERFPENTIIYMIDSVKLLTADVVSADVQSFFAEHQIPQSAKTLEPSDSQARCAESRGRPNAATSPARGPAVRVQATISTSRSPAWCRARSTFLSNLPTLVFGTSVMKLHRSGNQNLAVRSLNHERSSSAVTVASGLSTTQAIGRSSQRGSGTPITAASSTSGWPIRVFSRSTDDTHSPPLLMTSLARSLIIT